MEEISRLVHSYKDNLKYTRLITYSYETDCET